MNNPAISAVHPAAACPAWCAADHPYDQLAPDEHGWWNVLHLSRAEAVHTHEALPTDAAVELSVQLHHYLSEANTDPRDLLVWVRANSGYPAERAVDFTLTARQALRLAEVLVQHAAAVLAEESATTAVAR